MGDIISPRPGPLSQNGRDTKHNLIQTMVNSGIYITAPFSRRAV